MIRNRSVNHLRLRARGGASAAAVVLLMLCQAAHAQVIGPEQAIGVDVLRIDSQPVVAAYGQQVVVIGGHPGIPCAGRFSWTYSLDGGATWSPYELLGANTNLFGQPALAVDGSGRFYLANARCQLGGYRMSVTRGAMSGGSFVWDARVDVTPTSSSDLLDLPSIAFEPVTGTVVLAYTARRHLGGVQYETFIQLSRSTDSGVTWSVPVTLSSLSSEGGDLAVGPDGEIYVVWLDGAAREVRGRRSMDGGLTFGAEFVIGPMRPNYNTLSPGWQIREGRHRAEFPYGEYFSSDFPSVAVDRSPGPHRGRAYVTWTEMAAGVVGAANGLSAQMTVEPTDHPRSPTTRASQEGSSPQGCTIPPYVYYAGAIPVTIGSNVSGGCPSSDVSPCGCSGFLTFSAEPGTTLWIRGDATFGPLPPGFPPPPFTYTIQCGPDTTRLVEVGIPVLWDVFLLGPSPPFVTTLTAPGPYYIHIVGGGPYAMNYSLQLRTFQFAATEAARDQRDVVLTSSGDGGQTWAPKVRVNDDPPGFDNALAELAVDAAGSVHVAWYDRRDDPECGGSARTYWTHSRDGGASFEPSQPLSGGLSPWPFPYSVGYTIGDKLGLWAEGERVHAVWVDFRTGGNPDIFHAVVRDLATSTLVTRFEAVAEEDGVQVRWNVAEAAEVESFVIERAAGDGGAFAVVVVLAADGRSEYAVTDGAVEPGTTYRYRLGLQWRDGRTSYEAPVTVAIRAVVGGLALGRPTPAPFRDRVALELTLAARGVVDARVYDLLGHEVKSLQLSELAAGRHTLSWDGRDRAGRPLASGLYVVRARHGGHAASRNVLLVR
jgi:hypothetical protein